MNARQNDLDASAPPIGPRNLMLAATFGVCALLISVAAAADWQASFADHAVRTAASAETPADRAAMLQRAMGTSTGLWRTADSLSLAATAHVLADPVDLDRAQALTEQSLALAPAQPGAWARLADIDVRRHGRITGEGDAALLRSFVASPHGATDLQRWRIAFAARHWDGLSPATREAALAQVPTLAEYPEHRPWLFDFIEGLPPGVARLSLRFAAAPYE